MGFNRFRQNWHIFPPGNQKATIFFKNYTKLNQAKSRLTLSVLSFLVQVGIEEGPKDPPSIKLPKIIGLA